VEFEGEVLLEPFIDSAIEEAFRWRSSEYGDAFSVKTTHEHVLLALQLVVRA
jgi:hypothetical protein